MVILVNNYELELFLSHVPVAIIVSKVKHLVELEAALEPCKVQTCRIYCEDLEKPVSRQLALAISSGHLIVSEAGRNLITLALPIKPTLESVFRF